MAFFPVLLIAAVCRPLSFVLESDAGTNNLRKALTGLLVTAFAFLTSLSTNSLWSNANDVSASVRDMTVQERELMRLVENYESGNAQELEQLFVEYNQSVIETEMQPGALIGNQGINDLVQEIRDLVDDAATNSDVTNRLQGRMKDFVESRDNYLTALNDPGVPDVLWIAVVVLGIGLVGFLALIPVGNSRRFSSLVMLLIALAIGVIQMPMWVLSSYSYVELNAVPALESSFQAQPADTSFGAQWALVFGTMLLLAIAAIGVQLWNRRVRLQQQADDPADKLVQ